MQDKSKTTKPKKSYFTGIGLVFGTALGLIVSILANINLIWTVAGTAIGLLIGAIIDNNMKKSK